MTTDPPLHPLEFAARMLSISVRQVRRLIADGELQAVRLGHRTLRVRESDVAAFIQRKLRKVRR